MFTIDYKSRVPIYRQLVDRVEYLAAHGLLSPGSQLPSVRALAVELSINPNTIAKAYSELEAKGVIYSVPGRGSFVSDNTDTLRQETLKRLADKLRALAEEIRSLGMSKGDFIGICEQAWQEAKAKERDQKDD